MLPWLSTGVLRYAIVLSLGWISLAAIVVATSGSIAGETAGGLPGQTPAKTVRLDQSDPCTHEAIAIDARLFVNPIARVDVDVIHTDVQVLVNGWAQAGANRTERRIAIEEHFSFTRTLLMGLMGPADILLRLVERPHLPSTLLAVRLQPIWNGTDQTVAVTNTRLACE